MGEITIESATIPTGRDGERRALVAARTPEGARTWCASTDDALLHAIETTEIVGVRATRDAHGVVRID